MISVIQFQPYMLMARLVFLHIDSETGNKLFSGESEQDYKKAMAKGK